MIRSSSNDSSPPLMDNVGPRTDTPFWGAAGLLSGDASILNELAVGASFCFLNMMELLAMRRGFPRGGPTVAREHPASCRLGCRQLMDHRAFAETNRDASHSPTNRIARRRPRSARAAQREVDAVRPRERML